MFNQGQISYRESDIDIELTKEGTKSEVFTLCEFLNSQRRAPSPARMAGIRFTVTLLLLKNPLTWKFGYLTNHQITACIKVRFHKGQFEHHQNMEALLNIKCYTQFGSIWKIFLQYFLTQVSWCQLFYVVCMTPKKFTAPKIFLQYLDPEVICWLCYYDQMA